MRSVAPASPGSAASQKSLSASNWNPIVGRFTTTTLQTIQTAKARKSAGMEIQRFRFAMALPSRSQNSLSSGFQTVRTRELIGSLLEWDVGASPLFPAFRGAPAVQDGRVLEKADREIEKVNQLGERQQGDDQERPRRVQLEHQGEVGHVPDLRIERQERMEVRDRRVEVPLGSPAHEETQ